MKGVCLLVLVCLAWPASAGPPPYDLSEVRGMGLYAGPAEGRKRLAESGIVVTPETEKRLFAFYVAPAEGKTDRLLPYFITTDTAVRAFVEILPEAMAKFGRRQGRLLRTLIERLWAGLVAGRFQKNGPAITGRPRLGAARFAAVAARLLDPGWFPPTRAGQKLYAEIEKDVSAELKRVAAGGAVRDSPFFARDTDYSLCRPGGVYATDESLKRFFVARAFLSLPMNLADDGVFRAAAALGCFEDASIAQFREAGRWIVGREELLPAAALAGGEVVGEFVMTAEMVRAALAGGKLDAPREALRRAAAAQQPAPTNAAGRPLVAALLPGLTAPDSALLWRVARVRPAGTSLSGGLALLACCGNPRARHHVLAGVPRDGRKAFAAAIDAIRRDVAKIVLAEGGACPPGGGWIWHRWRRVLAAAAAPGLTGRHPKFMSTDAYADKSLNTALGGWVGLRHSFAVRVQGVCMLPAPAPRPEAGFVEPNLPFWDEMVAMTLDVQEMLGDYDAAVGPMASLTKLCMTARKVAAAQLAGRPLTKDQRQWVANFGRRLARLSRFDSDAVRRAPDHSIVSVATRDARGGKSLHVGLARPRAVYVIIDYGGRAVLARGGVMSYRHFIRPVGEELTDPKWRKMIAAGKAPPPPKWLSPLVAEKGEK